MPDEVIEGLQSIGEKALALYCVLGLCDSLEEYPSAGTLAGVLEVEPPAVWDLLQLLFDAGAVNDHDVQAVHAATRACEGTEPDDDHYDSAGG